MAVAVLNCSASTYMEQDLCLKTDLHFLLSQLKDGLIILGGQVALSSEDFIFSPLKAAEKVTSTWVVLLCIKSSLFPFHDGSRTVWCAATLHSVLHKYCISIPAGSCMSSLASMHTHTAHNPHCHLWWPFPAELLDCLPWKTKPFFVHFFNGWNRGMLSFLSCYFFKKLMKLTRILPSLHF